MAKKKEKRACLGEWHRAGQKKRGAGRKNQKKKKPGEANKGKNLER